MSVILTELEARIVEALKEQQRTINATAKALGLSDDRTRRAFRRLAEMGVIEQQFRRGPWTVLIDTYEIGDGTDSKEPDPPIDVDTSAISEDVRRYILSHAHRVPRSVLARRTGVPKLKLNQLLMEERGELQRA